MVAPPWRDVKLPAPPGTPRRSAIAASARENLEGVVRAERVTLAPARVVGDYWAGDSFAGALTFFLAHGLPVEEACRRAGPYGAAVLRGIEPLEGQGRLDAP